MVVVSVNCEMGVCYALVNADVMYDMSFIKCYARMIHGCW